MLVLPAGLLAPTQRTLPPFVLHRPVTLDEAVAAGAAPGAVYAQGCSDLMAQFREGLDCVALVSLERIPELSLISWRGADLVIGAGVTHDVGAHDERVRTALPGLAQGWGQIANHRIRQRATIGGNLMARRTRYEMSIMLTALGARLAFRAATGRYTLSPGDLWERRDPTGALLTAVTVPVGPEVWFGYERSMRPLMTAAVTVRGADVTLTVGSEYTRPHTVHTHLGADPALAAAQLPDTIADAAASADYRRHLAGVLLRRLLDRRAAQRSQAPKETVR